MNTITLSSSILSADFSHLADQIHACEKGGIDWIHVDVMDGHFVPNITMGPFIVDACRKITSLPLDVHLMIENPERYIEDFASAGASNLTIHIETAAHIYRTLERIRSLGCHPGIVLNPGTPASAIQEVLPLVDMVLVMSVNPGFSGQTFIPAVLPKMRTIYDTINQQNLNVKIQVDGGVTHHNIRNIYDHGARVYAVASSVFKTGESIADSIRRLREAVG